MGLIKEIWATPLCDAPLLLFAKAANTSQSLMRSGGNGLAA